MHMIFNSNKISESKRTEIKQVGKADDTSLKHLESESINIKIQLRFLSNRTS